MDFTQNYYAILGIEPGSASDLIKSAYREAARRFHPDVNKAPGALALFREINAAYEILADTKKREQYDQVSLDKLYEPEALSLQTFYSRQRLRQFDGPQLLYVFIKIKPLLERNMTSSAPLNLALIIDRSKSMQGRRMQNVKVAAQRIVDACSPDDIISIVSFSDRAEIIVPSQHVDDPIMLKSMISTIRADGATAMLSGLQKGLDQIERNRNTRYVNHMVLITDGRTYGDEEECLLLARRAHMEGVGISGMGIGEDWNDNFLDALATATGGSSAYISSSDTVGHFLEGRIRSLSTAYAERAHMVVAPTMEVQLDEVMRVAPDPIKLEHETQPVPLGSIDGLKSTSVMLQFRINTGQAEPGPFYLGRADVSGEVLGTVRRTERVLKNLQVEVVADDVDEEPPPELVDALSQLTLYRLQDRARVAIDQGNVNEATQQLQFLATRLIESGEEDLAQSALQEVQRVTLTNMLSEEGAKNLKYGTRALLGGLTDE